MICLDANVAEGADCLSPVVMAKLVDIPETVLAIYGEVSSVFDAVQTVLEAHEIAENDYWHEKSPPVSLATGRRQDGTRRDSSECTGSRGRCDDYSNEVPTTPYNAFRLQGLATPLTSRLSTLQIPPYNSLGRRERDELGFMPLILYTWLATLVRKRDHSTS